MDGYRTRFLLLLVVGLAALSGAGCSPFSQTLLIAQPPPPPALPPGATLQQVIQVVNNNSSQIESFSTNRATLAGPGFPTLRASIVFQRPRRFRLRADTALTGPELDLGSNDQLFWIWVRRNQPQAIYYCRHDQFATSPARRTIAIEPDWLIEAFGIVEFDPALTHEGPFPAPGGRLVVRTVEQTIDGPTTKVTVVHATRGVVLEQHVYDCQGQLAASAVASQHRRDPLSGLTMPKVVDIYCPRADFSMRIDLGNVQINRPLGDPVGLWTMPTFEGCPMVDLSDPRRQFVPSSPPAVPPVTRSSGLRPLRHAWSRVRQ